MNPSTRVWSQAPRALVAVGIALGVTAVGCRDAVLDLTSTVEKEGGGAAGAGTLARPDHAGGAGNDGQGGGSGTSAGALVAADFCADGTGECFVHEGRMSCSGEVGGTVISGGTERSLVRVDMSSTVELRVAFEICDPSGYVLNIGDSPTNNGAGGDWGQFENDAEILIYDGDLTASSSDLGYEQISADSGFHPLLLSKPGYVSKVGCSVRALHLRDQVIADADDLSLRTQSPTALRINPSQDREGTPDATWYIGINRVVSNQIGDGRRIGSGTTLLRLCFAVPPLEDPPRTGP